MPSRVSDAFKSHPVDFSKKYIDLSSLKELPESHAWKPLDHDIQSCVKSTESTIESTVPIIDLNDQNALAFVGKTCQKWGIFQIVNHGIETRVLDGIETAARNLFSLPLYQKLKVARSPNGVSGYGLAPISSFFPKLMWSEGFTIFGSPMEHARKLWPQDYKNYVKAIEEYEKEMQLLAARLMWIMLGSLGITQQDLKWAGPKHDFKGAEAAIQLNSYPACPDPDRAMGLAPHTDSTLITILHQNNTSGLQVFQEKYGWVTVQPAPGALVVNVGDLLHILSNGSYQSVLHRAVVNRTQHRISAAYLYGPPAHVQISPLPKLVGPAHPPLYRPVTWTEYLAAKAKHFDKALSSVRVCLPIHEHVVNGTNHLEVG